ncbi:MAG: site-2 protease family protein [Bryobacteraceae bacterium]|nr:site-2 protease family protein [Bryobacteraceae bacterium]MDW8377096.1 site-2 protease family protein [Bryobacterales bacterium]
MYALARERIWLHVLLFAVTFFTTTWAGARMAENFEQNRPAFIMEEDLESYLEILTNPWRMAAGLSFSVPLLVILLAHEFGHYLASLHYRIHASLPYFLPAPTLIGTLGAFIRVRSPIYSRKELFDIGAAGPLAGFVFLLPVLGIGLAYSKILPGIAQQGDLMFGIPLLVRALEVLIFPGVSPFDIYLHPMARAAWVGIFATALNLLPFGQLDGGHVLYAVSSGRFRVLTRVFWLLLIPLGLLYWPWWIWAAVLLFLGLKHPVIYDPAPLSAGRRAVAALLALIFVLCFMPAPLTTSPY